MPEKQNIYRSYGQKLISLLVRLMFSGESYSLTDLARMLDCSKQTVLRLLKDITMAYGVNIDETVRGNRKYISLRRPQNAPLPAALTENELHVLQMCRDFTSHILGEQLFDEATRALLKSRVLLPQRAKQTESPAGHFGSFRSGYIDYAPHYRTICLLIEAMEERRICRLVYRPIMEKRAKTYFIKPLKIFSHKETVYLHAQRARDPGAKYTEPEYDPLFAVHRIRDIEKTGRLYDFPANYDFERVFNMNFGVIKGKAFAAQIEFSGWAANFVSERAWSPDQEMTWKGKDRLTLKFSASSEPELISWVLSFGSAARLIKPESLKAKIKDEAKKTLDNYQANLPFSRALASAGKGEEKAT